MELAGKTIIMGIDITQDISGWNKRNPQNPATLDIQFEYALSRAETVEELQALKKFLLEHKAELKDVMPMVQESSGDNVKDMADHIDERIYNIKHNRNVV